MNNTVLHTRVHAQSLSRKRKINVPTVLYITKTVVNIENQLIGLYEKEISKKVNSMTI